MVREVASTTSEAGKAQAVCQTASAVDAGERIDRHTSPSPLLLHHGNILTLRKRHMHRLSSSTPSRESTTHERAIEVWPNNRTCPVDQVAQLYERELAVLTVGARITGFLAILTTRKVREILRQRRHPAYPCRHLLLGQAIPMHRHRLLRQTGQYAPRSEERDTMIPACARWFCDKFRF